MAHRAYIRFFFIAFLGALLASCGAPIGKDANQQAVEIVFRSLAAHGGLELINENGAEIALADINTRKNTGESAVESSGDTEDIDFRTLSRLMFS